MYAARANGKGGSQAYESSLDEGRILRRQIEREIASGLGRNEFDVVYQPLVDAQDFTTVGVEALVRSPGRPAGPLKPEKFIGIAKGSGRIQAPGMYVLGPVCRETRDIEGLCISVNVPPVRFSHQDCERQVRLGLDTAGLAPDRARRAIGAGFARDDFGCGFTSLACLQFYGFTCVKINRSLTKRVQPEQKAGHRISGLVQLAKGLDLRVVAEGVEGERLAKMLELAGCNELQGYHFGRPACPAQAVNMAVRPKQEITLACPPLAGVDAGLLRQFAGAAACLVLGVAIRAGTGTGYAWISNGRSPGTSS